MGIAKTIASSLQRVREDLHMIPGYKIVLRKSGSFWLWWLVDKYGYGVKDRGRAKTKNQAEKMFRE